MAAQAGSGGIEKAAARLRRLRWRTRDAPRGFRLSPRATGVMVNGDSGPWYGSFLKYQDKINIDTPRYLM
jgi:hypothetical protein